MLNKDPISSRYADAFFQLVKERAIVDDAARDMEELGEVISREPQLLQLLVNPDVEVEDKLGVLERLLQGGWSPSTRAFVHVALVFGRPEFLGQMADAFRELVDQDRGIVRAQVRSARALTEPLREQLRSRLERRERRSVVLEEETDPALLGGIQVILDNRIFDASIRTKLSELRQKLKAVRVH